MKIKGGRTIPKRSKTPGRVMLDDVEQEKDLLQKKRLFRTDRRQHRLTRLTQFNSGLGSVILSHGQELFIFLLQSGDLFLNILVGLGVQLCIHWVIL